jgi:hypothetical protein
MRAAGRAHRAESEKTMKRKLVHATLSIAVATLALACGGTKDTKTNGSPDAGKGGGSGGISGSGTGGSSGSSGGASGAGGLPFNLPEGGLFGPAEKVVLDPTCPDQHFNGGGFMGAPAGGDGGTTTLPGCCDKSGVCGISTAPFAGAFVSMQCLTAADIQKTFSRFGGFGRFGVDAGAAAFDAGPPKSCTYK